MSSTVVQGVRFGAVGAAGYLVNLSVTAFALETLELHYALAATLAFCVAVAHNFVLNRGWTFRSKDGRVGGEAVRFLLVSLASLGLGLVVLHALVTADLEPLAAQALSIAVVAPLSFAWNRLWTFAPAGAAR